MVEQVEVVNDDDEFFEIVLILVIIEIG